MHVFHCIEEELSRNKTKPRNNMLSKNKPLSLLGAIHMFNCRLHWKTVKYYFEMRGTTWFSLSMLFFSPNFASSLKCVINVLIINIVM